MASLTESNSETLDIAIVGAGAAGLMAAIFAGRTAMEAGTPLRIAALDGAASIGAKILVAGGGRCNVTHDVVTPGDFNGGNPRFVTRVLRSFDVARTIEFFREIGVELKREETGKLFPTTDDAQTVLDALVRGVSGAGVAIRQSTRVTAIARRDNGVFSLATPAGEVLARRVILATGGKSLPKTGSDGGGYALAQALGHTITRTTPALVPLVLPDRHWLTSLSGVTLDAEIVLASPTGKVIRRDRGSLLLTHFGLSGPVALDISRHWIAAHDADAAVRLTANLLPGEDFAAVEKWFVEQASRQPRASVARVLAQRLPGRLAEAVVSEAVGERVEPSIQKQTRSPHPGLLPGGEGGRGRLASVHMNQFSREQRRAIVHAITALPLPVVRDRGYLFAEVTAGGVPLDEVDVATMASRRCPGLYLCGEILDVDGRIGGFNFQWAWCTGRLAGINAASHG